MKKINLIIIILAVTLSVKVKALSATSTIECSAVKANVNDNITCNMKTTISSGIMYAISADIEINEGTEILNTKCDANWQGGITNSKIGVYTASAIQNKTIDICEITIKSKDNTNKENIGFALENVKYTDENYNTVNDNSTLKVNIPINNSNDNDDTNKVISNPETGAFLPVFVILLSITLALAAYNYTVKKNKFYKI